MGSSSNQQWNIDGAVISDIASGNSSPTYFDFDSFDEIQITTGGSDASQQGAGVQINFVTKSGGNKFRGSGRFFDTNERFEANNITDAQRDLGASAPSQLVAEARRQRQSAGAAAHDDDAVTRRLGRIHWRHSSGGRAGALSSLIRMACDLSA